MSPERAGDRPWWASEPPPSGRGRRQESAGEETAGAPPPHRHLDGSAACQVCPICTLLRLVDETRPEVLTHLTEAARHLTLAAKAIVDAQLDGSGQGDRFEHIPLDDDPPAGG